MKTYPTLVKHGGQNLIMEMTRPDLGSKDVLPENAADRIVELEAHAASSVEILALMAKHKAQHQQITALTAELEALRTTLAQVTAVGIVMLFDSNEADTLTEFSLDELESAGRVSESLQPQQVEKIYRRGFDAAIGKAQPVEPVAELEALKADAARYRFVSRKGWPIISICEWCEEDGCWYAIDEARLDKAIAQAVQS